MPYRHQGYAIAEQCKRIEMSYFTKNKYLKGNVNRDLIFNWHIREKETGRIGIRIILNDENKHLNLIYTITNKDNTTTEYDYKIYLKEVNSNLGKGKGKVYYFICPVTQRACRVLYMAYGSETFKSRFAYRYRIYYNIQTQSSFSYVNERYFRVEKQLEKLKQSRINNSYKGKETKSKMKYDKLFFKWVKYDEMRLKQLLKVLSRLNNKI